MGARPASFRIGSRQPPESSQLERMKPLVLALIRLYQNTISKVLPPSCRFYPSCSQYGYEAVSKYGVLRGGWLAVRRLARCHPLNPGGYDPVP